MNYTNRYINKFKHLVDKIKIKDVENISKVLRECKKKKKFYFYFW